MNEDLLVIGMNKARKIRLVYQQQFYLVAADEFGMLHMKREE
jgi:hypothetical protein